MPETSIQILSVLRDGSNFQWYVIPMLSFVFYVYTVEVEKRNWNLVLAGLAFWGADWANEIINSLVFHFSGYAPIWGTPGSSAFVILAGLNIEIMFMFAVAGIVWTKMLLPDKNAKILGINNRWFIAIAGSVFSVFVEVLLNQVNALTWEYTWWNTGAPWLIFLFGYLTFFIIAFWVYDMEDFNKKVKVVGSLWAIDIIALVTFISIGWI